jgi:hypothetical protein
MRLASDLSEKCGRFAKEMLAITHAILDPSRHHAQNTSASYCAPMLPM